MKSTASVNVSLKSPQNRRGRLEPYRFFFPAAMCHAATILPLAVIAMVVGAPLKLAHGPTHGTEMLTGFALAVIAGFLLPLLAPWRLFALIVLWLLGRAFAIAGSAHLWGVLPDVIFAAAIVAIIVPRFGRAAKKLRNRATGPLVALVASGAVTAGVLVTTHDVASTRRLLYLTATLLAALMLFMGGRIISASASGVLTRQGERVMARVQPRLEGALLLCFVPTIAGLAVPGWSVLAAVGAFATAVISLVRLVRWRVWRCRHHADIWSLGVGYGWVCAGLLVLGLHWLLGRPGPLLGLHCITVGGLGTLTINVMTRTWLQRRKIDPAKAIGMVVATVCISCAAVARASAIVFGAFGLNALAAAFWSAGFVIALVTLYGHLARKRAASSGVVARR